MPENAEAWSAAGDAEVRTTNAGPDAQRVVDYLRTLAEEAEKAIPLIEQTIADLKESLAAKKAEVKQFRAEHDKARKGTE